MKPVVYAQEALDALLKHRGEARRIREKVSLYAENPAALANNVKALKGSTEKRLPVGDYRVILSEDDETVTVTRIAPRGSAYD